MIASGYLYLRIWVSEKLSFSIELFLFFWSVLQDFIKSCQERDRGHKSRGDVTDRFCEKDCKYFVLKENRQDKDQRDQEHDLT